MLLLLMIIALLRLHHLRQQSRKDKHKQVMSALAVLVHPLGFPCFIFFVFLIVMAPERCRHSSAVAFASVVSVAAVGRGLWLLSKPTTGSFRHLATLMCCLEKESKSDDLLFF
ncbi:hypothetical protein L917_13230 [Phytophthora nicotianae]|uniref:Secreted peptide n=1 Tax=Phytophthora nicotianae TaxID=4792 RepID=W2KR51_PHYNI|nr:hypothetical protein L917_13230 [Phytophthora nicotianae]